MEITTYVELTEAQRRVLSDFEKVTVRTALCKPVVIATITTFQQQKIQLTIDANGIIQKVKVGTRMKATDCKSYLPRGLCGHKLAPRPGHSICRGSHNCAGYEKRKEVSHERRAKGRYHPAAG